MTKEPISDAAKAANCARTAQRKADDKKRKQDAAEFERLKEMWIKEFSDEDSEEDSSEDDDDDDDKDMQEADEDDDDVDDD